MKLMKASIQQGGTSSDRDLLRRPIGVLIGWGVPLLAFFSMNFARGVLSPSAIILVMSGALAWMGIACIANALRCGRLHCYLSGPIFLIGAVLIVVIGFDLASLGPVSVMHISNATIGLVAASFVLEWIWGAYAQGLQRSKLRDNH